MKTRPILMSAPMVVATLDETKTQTRRICELQHESDYQHGGTMWTKLQQIERCRYGKIGDRLWIRETWSNEGLAPDEFYYRATPYGLNAQEVANITWKPSIHMPRRACRLVIEITDLRAERLQDISEDDAIAEGITCEHVIVGSHCNGGVHQEIMGDRYFYPGCDEDFEDPIAAYQSLWTKINGPESWEKNPWVWVVSFRKVANGQ